MTFSSSKNCSGCPEKQGTIRLENRERKLIRAARSLWHRFDTPSRAPRCRLAAAVPARRARTARTTRSGRPWTRSTKGCRGATEPGENPPHALRVLPPRLRAAVGPTTFATGVELDAHTAPFAASSRSSAWRAPRSRPATRPPRRQGHAAEAPSRNWLAVLGGVNLVGGVAARVLAHEDKRMAWVFATFVIQKLANVNIRTPWHRLPVRGVDGAAAGRYTSASSSPLGAMAEPAHVLGGGGDTARQLIEAAIADRVRYESRRVNAAEPPPDKALGRDILV